MRCYHTSYRFFGDNERRNGRPISDLKALQKNKNRRRFTAYGGQVGAPHELFARPPLSPLFHLYTLAPLYLHGESGWCRRSLLLDLSRT
jgi:hypothetical protein